MGLSRIVIVFTGALVLSLLVDAPTAHADSGRLHLHLDLGLGVPVLGPTNRRSTHSNDPVVGGGGWVSADYQLAPPVAIELIFGIAGFGRPFPLSGRTGSRFGHIGIGARFRFVDDDAGYGNEDNGNFWSNLWVSAHIGYVNYDKAQFGVDVGAGYEFSVVRPLQLGVFTRGVMMFGGRNESTDMIITAGISIGLELVGTSGGQDSDGDGLTDAREAELGTDPYDDDTDGDLIPDGIEVNTGTNPLEKDTDNDGLNDGREDLNRNGILDAGESDPRRGDTDGGGMSDPDEVRSLSQDPQYPEDDDTDGDGVANNYDQCNDTPEGEEVNANGCPTVPEVFTLEGVQFRSGRADILDESENVLMSALATLRQVPTQRFVIAGHTDSQGATRANQRLSQRRAQAVLRWLIEHGLDRGRFEVQGLGEAEPVDTNDTPEGRARNRRIEFRRL